MKKLKLISWPTFCLAAFSSSAAFFAAAFSSSAAFFSASLSTAEASGAGSEAGAGLLSGNFNSGKEAEKVGGADELELELEPPFVAWS